MTEYEILLRKAISELGKPTFKDVFISHLSKITETVTAVTDGKIIFEVQQHLFYGLNSTYLKTNTDQQHKLPMGFYQFENEYPIRFWETLPIGMLLLQEFDRHICGNVVSTKPSKVFNNEQEFLGHLLEMISSKDSILVKALSLQPNLKY